MQAQAEGIVHGNPEKDIVAVKTVKGTGQAHILHTCRY